MNLKVFFLLAVGAARFGLASSPYADSTETVRTSSLTSTVALTPTIEPPPGDEISQGLWWLYQLEYERAHAIFAAYAQTHPQDPAGPFYMTATDWWQLAQNFDFKLPDIEKQLEDDYQKTVTVAHDVYGHADGDRHARGLVCLYWGGAEGLKGRWLVAQRQYVKAYFLGKKGNSLLHRALHYDPNLYDAYMGIGIYDYFTDTLSGVIKAVSALLIHGDRARGLRELHLAIEKGNRARVESKIFLVEIYTAEEGRPDLALPLTQELRKEFPTSPAMHLAEIMAYYGMHRWEDVAREAKIFLEKSRAEEPYYKKDGVRPAEYCLGMAALMGSHDLGGAMNYFEPLLENLDSSRWVSFAYLRRGQIHDLKGERQAAVADYETVLKRPDFWGSHKEATEYKQAAYRWPADAAAASKKD